MPNKNKQEKTRVVFTQRNKSLEPMFPSSKIVIGYDPEIHSEDAINFSYKLPLGAIKRLIRSYFETMEIIDEGGVYMGMSGSWEIRMYPYCNRMLSEIERQLNNHGLKGREIIDEVFNQYFKEPYDKMKRFSKNHEENVMDAFKECNDPECCKPKKEDGEFKMKNLKKLLNDFAHDFVNHCAIVKNQEIILSKEGLENLIEDYIEKNVKGGGGM